MTNFIGQTSFERLRGFAAHQERSGERFINRLERAKVQECIESKRELIKQHDIKADLVELSPVLMNAYSDKETALSVCYSIGMLAMWSKDALQGDMKALLPKNGTLDDTFGLYESTFVMLERYIVEHMPYILDYNELMTVCGNQIIDIEIKAVCTVCGSGHFKTIGVLDVISHHGDFIGLECQSCMFSPMAHVSDLVVQREQESMISSYIRSLLSYEGYSKDHGLGAHHERQVLASVATQAAKAFVHLPDGLSLDYQTLTKEEMSR